MFFGSAFWATSAPLYLYFKGVFEVAFKENIAVFGIAAVVAAFIILPIYNAVASRNREQLIAATRTTSAFLGDNHDEEKKKKERKAAVKRSGYYALFSVNMLYLVSFGDFIGYLLLRTNKFFLPQSFFLLFIAYILPTYELSHPINFTVASIFSAASVHGIGSSGLFI